MKLNLLGVSLTIAQIYEASAATLGSGPGLNLFPRSVCDPNLITFEYIAKKLQETSPLTELLYNNKLSPELTSWDSENEYSKILTQVFRTNLVNRFAFGGPENVKQYVGMEKEEFEEKLDAKINPTKKSYNNLLASEESINELLNLIPGGKVASKVISGYLSETHEGDLMALILRSLDVIRSKLTSAEYVNFIKIIERIKVNTFISENLAQRLSLKINQKIRYTESIVKHNEFVANLAFQGLQNMLNKNKQ